MISYFAPFVDKYLLKMTLTVQSPGTKLVEDNWGNVTPESMPAEIQCYVKDAGAKADRIDARPGGMGINSTYLEGFLVEPMTYPNGVQPPFECPAKISELDGRIRNGIFYCLPRQPQPYERDYTGERIAGWMVLN